MSSPGRSGIAVLAMLLIALLAASS